MTATSSPRIPKLRTRRTSNRAYVWAEGKRIYFGPPGPVADERYKRWVTE